MYDGSRLPNHTRLIWVYFLFDRIVGRINAIWGKNCPKLHCFGTFAGARAHHQGLRWLKPCQFQRNVYWHCEVEKLRPVAQFQLLAVVVHGEQMSLVSAGFNLQIYMKVSIKDGSDWKTFSVLLKPGKRLIKKHAIGWRWVFPAERKLIFPRMQCCRITARWLFGWGCWQKKKLLWLLFDFFGRTLHASWKQKSCFVMFLRWLNDWVNERRVQTVCLWRKISMKFLHCFGAGMLFICNLHSLTFLRKSTVLPSIFLHCPNAKQILLH